jgi:hypothetical protein
LDLVDYCAKGLLGVMNTDLTYFQERVPVITTMVDVFIAAGWALLIGNLVFQAVKAMMSGLGFEGENPGVLLARTGIFGFLLLSGRQICGIGLGIAGQIIRLLEIPTDITVVNVDESMFSGVGSAGWLLVIIFGLIMMFQLFKLLFEISERYAIVAILTFMSPFAFAMGGSKNTGDIFKGWTRMYESMLLMMIMNIVFLKMIISAMANVPTGAMLFPWLVLVVSLTKTAHKIDGHISKIGLNPATTGSGMRSGLPGMLAYAEARTMTSTIAGNMVGGSAPGTSKKRRHRSEVRF